MKVGDLVYKEYYSGTVELFVIIKIDSYPNIYQIEYVNCDLQMWTDGYTIKPAKDVHIKKYLAEQVKNAYLDNLGNMI